MNRDAQLAELQRLVALDACHFAEFVGTLHALRFTGPITFHWLNGQPQKAEVGRPIVAVFAEHPANGLDTAGRSAPSSG